MRLKYIISNNRVPILFSEGESHSDVARGVGAMSAGFVNVGWDSAKSRFIAECYGESITLHIKSAEGDSDKVDRMLNYY